MPLSPNAFAHSLRPSPSPRSASLRLAPPRSAPHRPSTTTGCGEQEGGSSGEAGKAQARRGGQIHGTPAARAHQEEAGRAGGAERGGRAAGPGAAAVRGAPQCGPHRSGSASRGARAGARARTESGPWGGAETGTAVVAPKQAARAAPTPPTAAVREVTLARAQRCQGGREGERRRAGAARPFAALAPAPAWWGQKAAASPV